MINNITPRQFKRH